MRFYQETGEDFLLNKNVRYFIRNSSVNKEIKASFIEDPKRFCYLNNGITIVCAEYNIASTGQSFNKVTIKNPSIVNGGQTISTLYHVYLAEYKKYKEHYKTAHILLRIYKAPQDYSIKIARATNSQNPISTVDLKSNETAQNNAKSFLEKFGIGLITKLGEETAYYDDTITNENILQIYASLYKDDPAKAKTSKSTTFKKYYDDVFNDSIDEAMCKRLFRCYQISKFILGQQQYDKVTLKNAFYSLMYLMKKFNPNILKENIPEENIQNDFRESLEKSFSLIQAIIEQKQAELRNKFSMNNLFKGNEIKSLIDIKFDELTASTQAHYIICNGTH